MIKQSYTKGGVRLDLRKSSITADILNILTDGKKHTMREIAEIVEVSEKTVRRHVQSLSYRYPIETFCGGIERGGVKLDRNFLNIGKIRTNEEIELIKQGLLLLKEKVGDNGDIENLIKEFERK